MLPSQVLCKTQTRTAGFGIPHHALCRCLPWPSAEGGHCALPTLKRYNQVRATAVRRVHRSWHSHAQPSPGTVPGPPPGYRGLSAEFYEAQPPNLSHRRMRPSRGLDGGASVPDTAGAGRPPWRTALLRGAVRLALKAGALPTTRQRRPDAGMRLRLGIIYVVLAIRFRTGWKRWTIRLGTGTRQQERDPVRRCLATWSAGYSCSVVLRDHQAKSQTLVRRGHRGREKKETKEPDPVLRTLGRAKPLARGERLPLVESLVHANMQTIRGNPAGMVALQSRPCQSPHPWPSWIPRPMHVGCETLQSSSSGAALTRLSDHLITRKS